jgi:hypothetical protein
MEYLSWLGVPLGIPPSRPRCGLESQRALRNLRSGTHQFEHSDDAVPPEGSAELGAPA